jgi:hypothetical protein
MIYLSKFKLSQRLTGLVFTKLIGISADGFV